MYRIIVQDIYVIYLIYMYSKVYSNARREPHASWSYFIPSDTVQYGFIDIVYLGPAVCGPQNMTTVC